MVMIFDNINILGGPDSFMYMIGYEQAENIAAGSKYTYSVKNDNVLIFDEDVEYIKNENNYIPCTKEGVSSIDIPKEIKLSNIYLFFPRYSIDAYMYIVYYALTLYIWISNKRIDLGTKIINRIDALANDKYKLAEDDYYEYITFPIADPYEIIYSKEWENFRKNVCKQETGKQLNNSGSLLYCSLHPVVKNQENYIFADNYFGGQNSLNISNLDLSNYINLSISDNIDVDDNKDVEVTFTLNFNKYYENNIAKYLKETYDIEDAVYYYKLVLADGKNQLYNELSGDYLNNEETKTLSKNSIIEPYIFDREKMKHIFEGMNMSSYVDGMKLIGVFNVFSIPKEGEKSELLLSIISNDIILPKEKFVYFLNEGIENYTINLQNMNITQINAVNKIENKIIQIDKPNDSKSNIIMPVFFKVNDLANIVIHPAVNENISINLDAYKSKVKSFIIQIEGIQFFEIGRKESGVIFKIVGKKLPQSINKGTYYILNQDQDMIVSGKYIYEV